MTFAVIPHVAETVGLAMVVEPLCGVVTSSVWSVLSTVVTAGFTLEESLQRSQEGGGGAHFRVDC